MATIPPAFLRGPLIVCAALASISIPYIYENVSIDLAVKLGALVVGFALLLHDASTLAIDTTRRLLSAGLDSIVIDDVLRAIYDPQEGLLAAITGTFVGNATMYALPMSPEQRTRLVQATLAVDLPVARTVLLEPGGCKLLLPPYIQKWIERSGHQGARKAISSGLSAIISRSASQILIKDGPEEDGGSEATDTFSITGNLSSPASQKDVKTEQTTTDHPLQGAEGSDALTPDDADDTRTDIARKDPLDLNNGSLDDPVMVMLGIVKGLIQERIRQTIQTAVPLKTIGFVSILALVARYAYRRRYKKIAIGVLERICSVSLFGVATGSLSTILMQHARLNGKSNSDTASSLTINKFSRLWATFGKSMPRSSTWRAALAFIVLAIVGKARPR